MGNLNPEMLQKMRTLGPVGLQNDAMQKLASAPPQVQQRTMDLRQQVQPTSMAMPQTGPGK
jgi:hypothetical protein